MIEKLEDYENFMIAIKGRSDSSVEGYRLDIEKFFEFLFGEQDVTLEQIKTLTKSDAYRYLAYCTKNGNNAKTRSRKVSSIRSFFLYLENECGFVNDVHHIDKPKTEKTLPKYLTLEQTKHLLSTIDNNRDYCIFTFFLNCGLRLSELSNIKLSDIRDNNTLVVYGKGAKERTIYLNDSCLEALNDYLAERESNSEYLFINKNGIALTRRGVQEMVKRTLKNAGLGEYSCHKLRHTSATMYYQYCGADVLELKEMLGHESIATTQIYTHVNSDQLRTMVDKSPLNNNNIITIAS